VGCDLRRCGKRQYERHGGSAKQRYLFCSVLLQRRRWARCRRLEHGSYRYAEPNADSYTYSYCNCYSNSYSYCYSNSYCHGDSYCDGYRYRNSHTNGLSDPNGNACADAYAYAYSQTHARAKRYAWTQAAGDSPASAVTGNDELGGTRCPP